METLDAFEAARVLGCTPNEARRLLNNGQPTTLERVERLALNSYRWMAHVDDPDSYWVTVKQAAAILGVSRQRIKQLLEADRLPHEVTHGQVRLMRREQLETVANARQARKLRQPIADSEPSGERGLTCENTSLPSQFRRQGERRR